MGGGIVEIEDSNCLEEGAGLLCCRKTNSWDAKCGDRSGADVVDEGCLEFGFKQGTKSRPRQWCLGTWAEEARSVLFIPHWLLQDSVVGTCNSRVRNGKKKSIPIKFSPGFSNGKGEHWSC